MLLPEKPDKVVGNRSPWPSQTDYQEMIGFPALCFSDPELSQCQVGDRTPFGMPLPFTGQFTNVYRMVSNDESVTAVRLFLREDANRAKHWKALMGYFNQVPNIPESLSPVEYQEKGFWLRGRSYPLVKMPWRTGIPLNGFIEKNLYDASTLRSLAEQWRQVTEDLIRVGFIHGDFQHGNVLVEEGSGKICLIDYDASFIPSLAGATNREAGHPSYQHPGRSPLHYGPMLDRFSALVIFTALRVLSVVPQLWFRLDNGDNLLFQREDFLFPRQSRAFTVINEALRVYPTESGLVALLQHACQTSPIHAPTLDRLL